MLSQKLKQYRLNQKCTQEELAHQLNVSRSAVAKWEQDKGIPNKTTLHDLASLLEVNVEELFEIDEAVNVINNITRLSKINSRRLVAGFSLLIVVLILFFLLFLYKPYGNVIDQHVSPDGLTTLTVYDNVRTKNHSSNKSGFKVELTGLYTGTWIKEESSYVGLYYSTDSRYVVLALKLISTQETWFELTDFTQNSGTNLNYVLDTKLTNYYNLNYEEYRRSDKEYQFLEWSDELNVMLIKFKITANNRRITGYFWSSVYWDEPLEGLAEIINTEVT